MNLVIGKNSIISLNLKQWFKADYISYKDVDNVNELLYDTIYIISFPKQYKLARENNFLFEKKILSKFLGKKIIYFSTSKVYPYKLLCSEDEALEPQSFYSENKIKIENIIPSFTNKYFILRISNAFDYNNFSKGTFFDILISNYKLYKKIKFDFSISSKKDFITLNSISSAITKITKKNNYGIYNIGSERGVKISHILKEIFKSDEILKKIEINKQFELNQTLNTLKLRKEIGIKEEMFYYEAINEIKKIKL